jgi:hypothetical protein
MGIKAGYVKRVHGKKKKTNLQALEELLEHSPSAFHVMMTTT